MAGWAMISSLTPEKRSDIADGLMIAVAVSLPWSTSATSILLALWLVAALATLDLSSLRHTLTTPSGGLPVLLVLFAIAGMVWADVTWIERGKGLAAFSKLLVIPLLMTQFCRSKRADWVFGGYVLSCIVLLMLSYILAIWPEMPLHFARGYGVPVKNAPTQSGEFVTCIFGLMYLAYDAILIRRWRRFVACAVVIAAMLTNMIFIATGRTALVVLFVLLAVFAFKYLSRKGVLLFLAVTMAVSSVAWLSSPYLRQRTEQIWTDYQKYEMSNQQTSSGERIEFAKKSIEFIRAAPIIGHGTGSIHALFIEATIGQTGSKGSATTNPHNQTFTVAIQLGFVGVALLWAMWFAHLRLLSAPGLAAWIGLVVVVQNIVGSAFNSHLSDFVQGWVYVIGVGVAGGVALAKRRQADHPL